MPQLVQRLAISGLCLLVAIVPLPLWVGPAWAGPIRPVDEWDPKLVADAPDIAKPFLKSLNTTGFQWEQPHKPAGMQTEAPGINPSRWGE